MPIFTKRQDPQAAAPLTRQPVDLKKLLAVYDDYPNVTNALDATLLRLEEAEEATRIAYEKRDDAEKDLADERQGRKADNDSAASAKDEALKLAKREKDEAEKAREEKIRNELNPKITDLETKLKNVTEHRDKLEKELSEKRTQMENWIKSLEQLSLERKSGYDKERKAIEDRWEAEAKTQKLDEEIVEGLKNALKPVDTASIRSSARSVKKGDGI
ncbi:uncharacterized protein I206_107316 [Kwoniella pini CBS 10737]|uniref:Uncharacterized protein n=1 Tax=Kwoniella pini CBS 10737 TaxID=1296096 RepID=A0A1B9HYK0_9TREE|nr:uncharacterized protein I206_05140 [Kwoniella pini CBS 10737]OCF48363.1 hypothetical protein I206_05140 [Kwoniella pini CBS 10737]